MHPTLHFGSFQISSYAAAYAVMIVVCGMYAFHRFFTEGMKPDRIFWGMVAVFLGGAAGAWVVRLIPTIWYWTQSGEWRLSSGITFIGMLPGGAIALAVYARQTGNNVWHTLDRVAVVMPLGQAIIRVGCFSAGCCYGKPTDAWWGMYLRNSHGDWATRYPTQLMFLALNITIWQVLRTYEYYGQLRAAETWNDAPDKPRMWPFDGFLFLLYAALYWIKRFGTEFLRADGILTLGGVNWAYILSASGFAITAILLVYKLSRARRQARGA